MLNPWKRKVKRENKVAQILASVESNPEGENVLKDIIKEYLPHRKFSEDDPANSGGLGGIEGVKTERGLFDDSDEKENSVNISDEKDSVNSDSVDEHVNDEKKKNDKVPIIKKKRLKKESFKRSNSRKSADSSSDDSSDQDYNRYSYNRINKRAASKSITRDIPTVIHKWTRSSEDSYEQQLALAIQQSLNEANKVAQNDNLNENGDSVLSTGNLAQLNDCNNIIKLTYRAKCIDSYCELCEEMYLGHSLLDLPQIVFKKMSSFEFENKGHVDICWNRAWNGYKLLCSTYRKKQAIDLWGPKEVILFELSMFRIGKEFFKMHELIPTKTVQDIVDFYYIWKKTQRYFLWKQVRHLTFEDLQTKDISDNLFSITSSGSNLDNDESSSKPLSPNTSKSLASPSGSKRSKSDSKSKHKK